MQYAYEFSNEKLRSVKREKNYFFANSTQKMAMFFTDIYIYIYIYIYIKRERDRYIYIERERRKRETERQRETERDRKIHLAIFFTG